MYFIIYEWNRYFKLCYPESVCVCKDFIFGALPHLKEIGDVYIAKLYLQRKLQINGKRDEISKGFFQLGMDNWIPLGLKNASKMLKSNRNFALSVTNFFLQSFSAKSFFPYCCYFIF
jgi:hypothetical protein